MTLNDMKARETEFRSFLQRKIKEAHAKHTEYAHTLQLPTSINGVRVDSYEAVLHELWTEYLWCQDMEYDWLMEFFELEDIPREEHNAITDWLNEVFGEEFRKLAEQDSTLPTAALEA